MSDEKELVESVAKRLHDLMKHPNEGVADLRTIGGTAWSTHYTELAREEYRVHARELIALVRGCVGTGCACNNLY